jgi:prolipoprotein diacylglyceryl transferase
VLAAPVAAGAASTGQNPVSVPSLVASIPSPHSGAFGVGPLTIHMYGLTLLVAILACTWLTAVRWKKVGGDPELVLRAALWGVAAGVIGARAYHVLTSWDQVPSPKWKGAFEIWQGGLGVWGGILLGTLVGAWVVHRAGASALLMMDAVAPGMLLAQGIGRIGNWWNQELYGKPTDLPWGLQIDAAHSGKYAAGTFHPTFLYELIWDTIGVVLLIWVGRRWRIWPPALFALYVSYYCFGRFFEELLRVDHAHVFGPLRLNAWVSIALFVGSTAFFVWWQLLDRGSGQSRMRLRRRPSEPSGPKMVVPKSRVRTRS